MSDRDRRNFPRRGELAHTPIEAMVEDGGSFIPVFGAELVNQSEGGVQLIIDEASNLSIGKTLVIFLNVGSPPKRKQMETSIVWMSESDGRVRLGLEFSYPLRGVPYYF